MARFYIKGARTMNKQQAIKKIDELKRFVQECEVEEPKNYYWTYVRENIIHHNNIKEEIREDVVYEDENIIVERYSEYSESTYISYKNGEKA